MTIARKIIILVMISTKQKGNNMNRNDDTLSKKLYRVYKVQLLSPMTYIVLTRSYSTAKQILKILKQNQNKQK